MEKAVRRLDRSVLEETYSGRGSPAYRPDIMLRLAVYETMRGVGSPSRWASDAEDRKSLHWLLRGLEPSVRACYRFRDRLGEVVEEILQEIIKDATQEGLLENPEVVAQDGSFHRACASRHRLVNQDQLSKRRSQLEECMQAEPAGNQPPPGAPYWMPSTPIGRADLLSRMEKVQQVLEERLEKNARRRKSHRLEAKHVCVSLSDPEAPIGRDKEKVFCPLYTAQYMTDYRSGLVLGFEVTATATDVGTLIPMIDKIQPLVGGAIKRVCTDATYATVLELAECQERNIDLIALILNQANVSR